MQTDSRFDLQESVNFEVENGFCPGLEMSHAHVIPLLDTVGVIHAEEVWQKALCHCLNLGLSDVNLLSMILSMINAPVIQA